MSTTKDPAANPSIALDPNLDGSVIRKAFLAEAVANLLSLPLLTNTSWVLGMILKRPSDVNSASILFARLFGGIVVGGLTSALLAGATNTRNGIESRRVVYLLLGIGEALLIPVLANEMLRDDESRAALSRTSAGVMIGMLSLPLLWRFYVLFLRPEMLGKYRETKSHSS